MDRQAQQTSRERLGCRKGSVSLDPDDRGVSLTPHPPLRCFSSSFLAFTLRFSTHQSSTTACCSPKFLAYLLVMIWNAFRSDSLSQRVIPHEFIFDLSSRPSSLRIVITGISEFFGPFSWLETVSRSPSYPPSACMTVLLQKHHCFLQDCIGALLSF